jgi:hypothetical protein
MLGAVQGLLPEDPAFLAKPFTPEGLRSAVRAVLEAAPPSR